MISFTVQNLLSLIRTHLFVFVFIFITLECELIKILLCVLLLFHLAFYSIWPYI